MCFEDELQQGTVLVGEHLRHRMHRLEPDFRFVFRGDVFALRDGQRTGLVFFAGDDSDLEGLHGAVLDDLFLAIISDALTNGRFPFARSISFSASKTSKAISPASKTIMSLPSIRSTRSPVLPLSCW